MTLTQLWTEVGHPKLESLERLNAVFGAQLEARAAESDGALNRLIRSLCGESAWADLWERVLAWLQPHVWREHFASVLQKSGTLGTLFDGRMADAWAELEAINRFVGLPVGIELELLPTGADFKIRLLRSGRLVLIEVKRANGLADELRLAADALRAGQLMYPEVESPRVVVWGTETYHAAQFDKRGKQLVDVADDIKRLVNREYYDHVVQSLTEGQTVDLSARMISVEAEEGATGVVIQPYAPREMKGRLDTMAILHATGDILLKARSALPQLYVTSALVPLETPITLAPYVYYDAWELGGVDLGRIGGYLDGALGFDPRVALIIDSFGDQWFFGRNGQGVFDVFGHAQPWLDDLDS